MNRVVLMGRLVRDPEMRVSTGNGAEITKFTVAVDRYKDGADFIPCVAFGKTATFINEFFSKGQRILLEGHINTGSYTNKDGQTVYTTDVLVDRCEFCENKSASTTPATPTTPADDFVNVNDDIDAELPFA